MVNKHSDCRYGPRTRWKHTADKSLVGGDAAFLFDCADAATAAAETLRITEKGYAWVQEDAGFRETVWLLTQMGIAAGKMDPLVHLVVR